MTLREMTSTSPSDKQALRRDLKRRRRALSAQQQRQAALALCQRLKQLPEIRRAKRISLYLPVNGEIDPTPLIPWLRQRRVAIYLPVLRPFSGNRLWFVAYDANTPMINNRFGIAEPCPRFAAQRRHRLPSCRWWGSISRPTGWVWAADSMTAVWHLCVVRGLRLR